MTILHTNRAESIQQLFEYYKYSDLKDMKLRLEPEEREQAIKAGAHWSDGRCGIWKARTKSGEIVYGSNTHRAMSVKPTLGQAIKAFPFIKSTS